MPRPQKSRTVDSMPNSDGLIPAFYCAENNNKEIFLTVDEFETIRLIDYQKLTQEQCAESMNVSRSTVAAMYEAARFKLADALLNEKPLLIGGGNFTLSKDQRNLAKLEENKKMKIAVTYENGQVYQHFGHCKEFKVYTVENKTVTDSVVLDAAGSGHGALAGFLKKADVDILICGGIGGGAKIALAEAEIQLLGGVHGSTDDAVNAYINGTLEYNANVECNHHGSGNHSCGSHEHGEHRCGHSQHKCHN